MYPITFCDCEVIVFHPFTLYEMNSESVRLKVVIKMLSHHDHIFYGANRTCDIFTTGDNKTDNSDLIHMKHICSNKPGA